MAVLGVTPIDLMAREVMVQDSMQLAAALQGAQPGDVIILKNGSWKNADIAVTKGGEPGKPVEIRAEKPGEVILSGSSKLGINAPYVTVDGLVFYQGAIAKDAVIQFNSHHGIVRETAIIDYNPASFETGYYWVFFAGSYNQIDRCYLKGKNHMEPLVGNKFDGSQHNSVTNSFIQDIPYAEPNGREIFRVWGPGQFIRDDENGAFFTIEGNLFDHADGEGMEIISLKSNHNTVLRNTIVATHGGINIRRGNFNTIKDNIILGQGMKGALGYRMTGEHNLIQGNFAIGCEYGIEVSCGEFIGDTLTQRYQPTMKGVGAKLVPTRVPFYPQNQDVTLVDNVMVGNSGPDLNIGSSYKSHWPESQQVLLPEDCLIKNNRFVRPRGGESIVGTIPDTAPPLDRFNFKPNHYKGNILEGGKNAYAPAAGGFTSREIPAGWSEAQETATLKPLTPDDVGPAWLIAMRKAGNFSLYGKTEKTPE